jgi:hypothetical protein
LRCGGTCRDLSIDRLHCGRCYNKCAKGKTCQAGVCK